LKNAKILVIMLSIIMLIPMMFVETAAGQESLTEYRREETLILPINNLPAAAGQESLTEYRREETLILPINNLPADPLNCNPFILQTNLGLGLMNGVYESLFYFNVLTGELIPWLAKSYEWNEDFTNLTLYLRDDVYWSDGYKFTAYDVNFTLGILTGHPERRWGGWGDGINHTVIVDDYTIVIVFNESSWRWEFSLFNDGRGSPIIVPKHVWEGQDPDTFKNYPPIGTGPYVLVSASAEAYIYKRNDDYWGKEIHGLPKPKYIIYRWVPEKEVQMMKLMGNEMDLGLGFTADEYYSMKETNPDLRVWSETPPHFLPDLTLSAIAVNLDMYPFNYSEVRWAISYAIDRERVINTVMPGVMVNNDGTPWATFYHSLDVFENRTAVAMWNTSEYNPEKSIQLLESLGFTRGEDGIFVTPNGTRLSFLYHVWDSPGDRAAAHLVQEDLRAVGIEVELKFVRDWAYWSIWATGTYEMLRDFESFGNPFDPYSLWALYNNTYIVPRGQWTWFNRWRWNNTEFSELVGQLGDLSLHTNRSLYIDICRKLHTLWLKDLPWIPLWYGGGLAPCYNTYYWTGWPGAENPYAYPYYFANFLFVLFNLRPNRPPEPVTVTISNVTATSLILSWSESTAAYFDSYEIFQSTTEGQLGSSIAKIPYPSLTNLTIHDLQPGVTYYFTVRVWNTEGLYSDSEQVSTKTQILPTPFYMEPWFISVLVVVIVILVGVIVWMRKKISPAAEGPQ